MVKVVVDYNDDPVYFEDKADRRSFRKNGYKEPKKQIQKKINITAIFRNPTSHLTQLQLGLCMDQKIPGIY